MTTDSNSGLRVDWLDPLRAFALFGVLLNHLVEEFGPGPWFTNPSNGWPDLATRMSRLLPTGNSLPVSLVQFLGWLGDSAPGVFILVSGTGLTLSALKLVNDGAAFGEFFRRRVLRIFPLYIAMHFCILAASLLVPGSTLSFASRKTLLSIFGLRFTSSTFFYISPAWWFIWLILQLYCLFPLLFRLLRRAGTKRFFLITCALTFASRLFGILFSHDLYYWMTGIFFGTRLAEFCAGMAIAAYLWRLKETKQELPGVGRILPLSICAYLVGLACSFTLAGSVASNLLVTLGLSGMFYSVWQGVKKTSGLATAITWVGITSYSVYLLHQTPLRWTRNFYPGTTKYHLVAAVLVLLASFPVGWLVDRSVSRVLAVAKTLAARGYIRFVSATLGVLTVLVLALAQPRVQSEVSNRLFALLLAIVLLFELYAEYLSSINERPGERLLRWTATAAVLLQLYILPQPFAVLWVIVGSVFAVFAIAAARFLKSRVAAWPAAAALCLVIGVVGESALKRIAPLEAGCWGELPALQVHPDWVYSLKPNQVTHLKYNNYDYVVKTNSLGLAGPEIDVTRPSPDTLRVLVIGDAFSMPEGVEYQYSYPCLLEKELARITAPRRVQVINAGVTGYGPAEEWPQLAELGPMLKPDVVVYQFFINEFTDASISADDRLRAIGLRPKSESMMDTINHSQSLAHLRQVCARLDERLSGKPGAWRQGKALLDYYRAGDNAIYSDDKIARVRFCLEAMNKVCTQIGSPFLIYLVPAAIAVCRADDINYFPWDQDLSDQSKYDLGRPLRTLKVIADEIRVPVVDLTPYLRDNPEQPVYFRESWHWNREGHRVVAGVITHTLIEGGYVQVGNARDRNSDASQGVAEGMALRHQPFKPKL